jgi:uncharacterized protein (UPF0179 family)
MSTTITLLGTKQARVGLTFLHCGPVENCKECKLLIVCQKLEPGRVYEVVKSRGIVHPCAIHEGGVTLVEVREASIPTLIDRRSCFLGALIVYSPQKCDRIDCEKYRLCNPAGLHEKDKCRIEEIVEKVEDKCTSGRQLSLCRLKRVPTT